MAKRNELLCGRHEPAGSEPKRVRWDLPSRVAGHTYSAGVKDSGNHWSWWWNVDVDHLSRGAFSTYGAAKKALERAILNRAMISMLAAGLDLRTVSHVLARRSAVRAAPRPRAPSRKKP